MSKYVSQTAAARSISAYIVLKEGRFIGRIQAHHTESTCRVDVWNIDGDARGEPGFQQSRGKGYGVDKEKAALCGLVIGGATMTDMRGVEDLEKAGLTVIRAI